MDYMIIHKLMTENFLDTMLCFCASGS